MKSILARVAIQLKLGNGADQRKLFTLPWRLNRHCCILRVMVCHDFFVHLV